MAKFSKTELACLSNAATHKFGVLVFPDNIKQSTRQKTIDILMCKGLIQEVKPKQGMPVWRKGEDNKPISLVINKAGRVALKDMQTSKHPNAPKHSVSYGRTPPPNRTKATLNDDHHGAPSNTTQRPIPHPRAGSKKALLITLLSSNDGASITALMQATDWQPHTIRAALSGLRKRGFTLDRSQSNGQSHYRLLSAPHTSQAA